MPVLSPRWPHCYRPDGREHLPLGKAAVANHWSVALGIDRLNAGGNPLFRLDLHRLGQQPLGAGTQHFRPHLPAPDAWKWQLFDPTGTQRGGLLKKKTIQTSCLGSAAIFPPSTTWEGIPFDYADL